MASAPSRDRSGHPGGPQRLTASWISGDATTLNTFLNGGSPAALPVYPGPPSNNPAGPDPTISIPTDLPMNVDGTVTVPVNIDDPRPAGSNGMTQATLALTYDPSVFRVSAVDIHLGTVVAQGSGWTLQSTINPVTGQIGIVLFSVTPIASSLGGSLVTIDFHLVGKVAPGTTPINLAATVNPTGHLVLPTTVDDAQGPFTLYPTPTNATNDAGIDGSVFLTSEDSLSATTSASAGNSGETTGGKPELAVEAKSLRPATEPLPGGREPCRAKERSSSETVAWSNPLQGVPFVNADSLAMEATPATVAAAQATGLLFQFGNVPVANTSFNNPLERFAIGLPIEQASGFLELSEAAFLVGVVSPV